MLKLRFSTPKGVDYGVRKRSFRLMLKLRFSTPNRSACGSPLSHTVGEGLGVRAKMWNNPH
jgi:hypothetical protein